MKSIIVVKFFCVLFLFVRFALYRNIARIFCIVYLINKLFYY